MRVRTVRLTKLPFTPDPAHELVTVYSDSDGALHQRASVEDGGAITDLGSGGGGGSQAIQSATVTLTDAQIKALPSTPFTLVAAPGSGKLILPVDAVMSLDAQGGAYTNVTNQQMWLSYGSGGRTISAIYDENTQGAFADDSAVHVLLGFSNSQVTSLTGTVYSTAWWSDDTGGIANAALTLGMFNGGGDLTGGDPANSLKVTVLYAVVDLV